MIRPFLPVAVFSQGDIVAPIIYDEFTGAAGDLTGRLPTVVDNGNVWLEQDFESLNVSGTGFVNNPTANTQNFIETGVSDYLIDCNATLDTAAAGVNLGMVLRGDSFFGVGDAGWRYSTGVGHGMWNDGVQVYGNTLSPVLSVGSTVDIHCVVVDALASVYVDEVLAAIYESVTVTATTAGMVATGSGQATKFNNFKITAP